MNDLAADLYAQLRDVGLSDDQIVELLFVELVHREAWHDIRDIAQAMIDQREAK